MKALGALLAIICFATGGLACGDSPGSGAEGLPTAQSEDLAALPWDDWKRIESARRKAHYESARREPHGDLFPYYALTGLPDMSLWRPEDFVSEEDLRAPHVDICSLPREQGLELMEAVDRAGDPEARGPALDVIRRYAEAGVIQAQSYFSSCHEKYDSGYSVEEAQKWTRRAAASGEIYAMEARGDCIEQAAVNLAPLKYPMFMSFAADEMLYWDWRAAQGLAPFALTRLSRYVGLARIYSYGDDREDEIEDLKWKALRRIAETLYGTARAWDELVGHFRSDLEQDGIALPPRRQPAPDVVQEASRRALAWLERYPDALEEFRSPFGCPDRTWYDETAEPHDWKGATLEIQRLRRLANGAPPPSLSDTVAEPPPGLAQRR